MSKEMNLAISIRGPIIATKFEPIQEEEWKYTELLDKIAAKTDDDVSFWVAFFCYSEGFDPSVCG